MSVLGKCVSAAHKPQRRRARRMRPSEIAPPRLTAALPDAMNTADFFAAPLALRLQPGYDHSYYFIASFIGDHIAHHAAALKA